MALSYDDWKNQWEGMTDVQRARVSQSMKDNATFQDYGKRYVQEQKGMNINPTGYQNSTQNTGSTVSNNQNSNVNNTQGTNTQQDKSNWQNQTVQPEQKPDYMSDQFISDNSDEARAARARYIENMNKQNEQLDTSKFGESTGPVQVKEGTAAQTGQPDYMLNSEARQKEIVNNLNTYWQTNREFFKDRNTFNTMFHYDERDDSQKQLLDSYWKKKTDTDVAMKYTNADSIASGMNNYEITPDQLSLIQDANPDEYKQRQAKVQEQTDLRIANLATPNDPTQTADLFNTLLQKLNLEPGDPYKIYDNWYDMAERLGVFSDSARLSNYQNQLDANHSKMENIMSRYASSAGGTQSDALVAARLSKALAPYQQIETDLQNSYTALLNGRNSNLAVANQSAQALAMQAAEDQRIFNQRLAGLGFAMNTASYRSPEQQAQLGLQTAQIQNDMNLLNQSKLNDLSLYNQRQLNAINLEFQAQQARQQNLLNNELTDLSVSDPQQLRANLNNVLSQYYDQWGDIIKRPQQQSVDDIIAYAKEKGISVAQALKENFLDKLQSKQEYKNAINSKYPNPLAVANSGKAGITINSDGTLSYSATTAGGVEYKPISNVELYGGYRDFSTQHQDGEVGGWCGKFVNDYLQSLGYNRLVGDSVSSKLNIINSGKDEPIEVGSVAVFDYEGHGIGLSEDAKKYGHVAIVAEVDEANGRVRLLESNLTGNKKVTNSRWVNLSNATLKGFFNPAKGSSEGSSSNLSPIDREKKENYLEEARRGQMTDSNVAKIGDIAAEQGWGNEWREALKQGKKTTLTDAQIKLMDKTDAQFSSNGIVKEFEDAINQIEQLQVALNDNSGVGDMSAIFTFMKTLDPSSVVRESEFNSAAATAGVLNPSAIWQKLEKNANGQFLTSKQREDFKAIAKEFIKTKANNYNVKYNDLLKRYNEYGLDSNLAPTNMADIVLDALNESGATNNGGSGTVKQENTNWYQSLIQQNQNVGTGNVVMVGGTAYSSNFYDN